MPPPPRMPVCTARQQRDKTPSMLDGSPGPRASQLAEVPFSHDLHDPRTNHVRPWGHSQSRCGAGSHETVVPHRRPVRVAHRHIAVEVRAGEAKGLGCAMPSARSPPSSRRHPSCLPESWQCPSTHTDRACLALVSPPSLLILRLTTSIARSALARSSMSRPSMFSSSTNG